MILIGMFDSPFVRRVAIALKLYGIDFQHRGWSVFRDAEEIAEYNPLVRVPTLVLDHGEVLVETFTILDALDEMAGGEAPLCPRSGPERRRALKLCALASGAAEKLVSLLYERAVHERNTPEWEVRCKWQIDGAFDELEEAAAKRSAEWMSGDALGHADVAAATSLTFMVDALPDRFDVSQWPKLMELRAACEARPEFRDHHQAFFPPPSRST